MVLLLPEVLLALLLAVLLLMGLLALLAPVVDFAFPLLVLVARELPLWALLGQSLSKRSQSSG
jgi:hypothetical protein